MALNNIPIRSSGSAVIPHLGYDGGAIQAHKLFIGRPIDRNSGAPKMMKLFAILCIATTVTSVTSAHADTIEPLAAQHLSLGPVEGVAYYTKEPDGFRVVTTFVEGDDGRPVRMIAYLVDGQSIEFSIPNGVNEPEQSVRLSRDGDVLILSDPLEPLTASIGR